MIRVVFEQQEDWDARYGHGGSQPYFRNCPPPKPIGRAELKALGAFLSALADDPQSYDDVSIGGVRLKVTVEEPK